MTLVDGAPAASMSTVVRLRPIVHATKAPRGVHIRGWASSFTIDGGPGVWRLWQAIAPKLTDGLPADQLGSLHGRAEVTRAVEFILAQLREHGMLVEVPAGWGGSGDPRMPGPELAAWLESVADDPAAAWRRLRKSTVTVDGDGTLVAAACRALTGTGLSLDIRPARHMRGLRLVANRSAAVVADCGDDVGYVVPAGPPDEVARLAAGVAARLGLIPGPGAGTEPPDPLAALVAGAAAHRLVCAVAGLADPAREVSVLRGGEPAAAAGSEPPAVLVARVDPLSATYHPWLPGALPRKPAGGGIDEVLRWLDELTDPQLGVLPEPVCGELPQLPAALAVAGDNLGVAATADVARVAALLAAAETAIGAHLGDDVRVTVGVDGRHASGVALRRLVHAAAELRSTDVPQAEWAVSAQARRWWKALTLRFAVPARIEVRRLATNAVHARVTSGGVTLGWAVEAEAGDAVALAALAATGLVQARAGGLRVPGGAAPVTGAAPSWEPDRQAAPWADEAWYWPAGLMRAEPDLQATLRALVPAAVEPVPLTAATDLTRSLVAVGFVALTAVRRPGGEPT